MLHFKVDVRLRSCYKLIHLKKLPLPCQLLTTIYCTKAQMA